MSAPARTTYLSNPLVSNMFLFLLIWRLPVCLRPGPFAEYGFGRCFADLFPGFPREFRGKFPKQVSQNPSQPVLGAFAEYGLGGFFGCVSRDFPGNVPGNSRKINGTLQKSLPNRPRQTAEDPYRCTGTHRGTKAAPAGPKSESSRRSKWLGCSLGRTQGSSFLIFGALAVRRNFDEFSRRRLHKHLDCFEKLGEICV